MERERERERDRSDMVISIKTGETMVTDVTLHPDLCTKDLIKEFYPSQGILTVAIVTTIR